MPSNEKARRSGQGRANDRSHFAPSATGNASEDDQSFGVIYLEPPFTLEDYYAVRHLLPGGPHVVVLTSGQAPAVADLQQQLNGGDQ